MKKGATLKGEIARINNLKPKQYKQGWTEFYKLKFKLTPDVLIPRPETETLVEEVIKLKPQTVLDLGTGSGAIAISIAKNLPAGRHGLPDTKVIATDLSEKALKVAEQNAKSHQVQNQIIFLNSNLLDFVTGEQKVIPEIIVTNLPYIPTARLLLIDPMVVDFEPKVALDGGIDGFELYRKLFAQMTDKNFIPKYLIAEVDDDQKEVALAEVKKYFPNAKAEVKKDLFGWDRILVIRF